MSAINDEFNDDLEENEEHLVSENGDGLADMMSRILNQQVGLNGSVAPVLAKRKTPMMKDLETKKKEIKLDKKSLDEKRKDGSKQMVDPSSNPSSIDFERQLKKLATRGGS